MASIEDLYERTLEFLGWRKRAYLLAFPKDHHRENPVLKDLARVCHINEDCPHSDPFELGRWMGRQEVFRRIQRHVYLSPEDLFAIYSGVRTPQKENRVA